MKDLDNFIIDNILQARRPSHREVLSLEVVFQLLNGGIRNSSNGVLSHTLNHYAVLQIFISTQADIFT